MDNLDLFNSSEQIKKVQGMESAAKHYAQELMLFRAIAESIPGLITIDSGIIYLTPLEIITAYGGTNGT